jgi:hypothetical protein
MRTLNRLGRPRRGARILGQSMVEFALVLPVLAILLLGGAQVGALLYGQVTLDTAARDGARLASEQPNHSGAFSSGVPLAMSRLTTAISRQSSFSTLSIAPLTGAIVAGQDLLLVTPDLKGVQHVNAKFAAGAGATSITLATAATARYAFDVKAPVLATFACQQTDYAGSTGNTTCAAVYKALGFLSRNNTPVSTYVAPLCSYGSLDFSDIGAPACSQGSAADNCVSSSVKDGQVLVATSFDVPLFIPILGQLLQTPGASSGAHVDVAQVANRVVPCTMQGS